MKKEMLSVEFRYLDAPHVGDSTHNERTVVIGIYDTLEEAIAEGNKVLESLAKHFQIRPDDKFQFNHLFGFPRKLVTNTCYPTNGIQFFVSITTLEFGNLSATVDETFAAFGRYKEYKRKELMELERQG